ncbi:OmpA family protein [Flavobacterium sp. GT3R68]|uniref:OmpA family protein n=1 Tax=Flavobacterium sp. GT3R68 TaxID=2594437 RepID=UPI000F877348|nr:OmpA family protein [Flavobacterium sp. GT3R68]RTY94928.1 flagellar motor protein MotB [Flavobacterium sp. GSN2]TRW91732.1 OmpA family protein [Flavobacterium sp. GT3R68]
MKSKLIIYVMLLGVLANGYAQKAAVERADKKYERYAYVDAIKTYERIAAKGYKSVEMFQKLGNAYYFNAELDKAAKWYGELFAMTQDVEPEYYYRYSQSLKSIGEYAKADEMLVLFNQKSGNDLRGKLFSQNRNYLAEIKANSGRYNIEDAGVNSKYSDYGSSFSGNQLVFTSARDTGSLFKIKDKWTNQYFTNMYSSEISADTVLGPVKKFARKINTKFHEATPVFTKDGQTVYFTRNNFNNGKKGKDANRVVMLKIYKATLVNKEWDNEVELPFNSNNYSVAHPALSPDEKTLYFASDMPGTLGQSDIFKVKINEDGSYGVPENLGFPINTEGKETFPYVSNENELYFASDGHPGLGGLDIFASQIAKDGSYRKVKNIGEPANSPKDDFGYLIDVKTRKGFLSSNRVGGQGYDDIYKFLETRKLNCEQALSGIVTDLETSEILPDSKVTLFDDKFTLIKEVKADDKGHYEFEVECEMTYYVRGEKEAYETKEQKITISNVTGKTDLPIQLEKKVKPVTVGDDLAKAFGIKMIYFDFDKWDIRTDAAYELEKILDVMKEYPNMKIDVRSHTDSRGSFEYNDKLSGNRANSTMEWLIKNGVKKDRLTGKGYGERELFNKCADNVECSEEDHQLNRRSQFIITAL